jgi:hypothetical protein
MPDLIRHPVFFWIPASAGMTTLGRLIAGLIRGITGDIEQSGMENETD